MSDENVYETPESDVYVEPVSDSDFVYTGPKSTSFGSGLSWISAGWKMFKQDPGQWMLTVVVFFVISIILSLIPIVGQIISAFITYVWLGGLMLGCQAAKEGKAFNVEYLFAGFSNRLGALVGLSALLFIIFAILMFAALGNMYFELMTGGELDPGDITLTNFFLPILIVMAVSIPLVMLVWFAPALLVLQKMSLIDALKASFVGCLKNVLPYLLYGIVMFILYMLGAIPLLLGWLLVVPLFFTSMYASYVDIFLTQNTQAE